MSSEIVIISSFFVCLIAFLFMNNLYLLKKVPLGKKIFKNILLVLISPLSLSIYQFLVGRVITINLDQFLDFSPDTIKYKLIYIFLLLFTTSLLLYLFILLYSKITGADINICRFLYIMLYIVVFCIDMASFNPITVVIISILMYGYTYRLFKNNLKVFQENTNSTALKTINVLPIAILAMQYILVAFWNIMPSSQAQTGVITPVAVIMALFSIGLYILLCFSYKIAFDNYEQKVRILKDSEEKLKSQEEIILAFAEIIEAKSRQTGQHVKRVSEYSYVLAKEMNFSEEEAQKIRVAAMMHDIGKFFIPSSILEKPGKLTREEFEIIKTHVTLGESILQNAPGDIMAYAKLIALDHHEKWNGEGYLHKKEDEISLVGRIVAVADVYDALVSKRSYKSAWPEKDAKNQIITDSGTHFDPSVVDVFVKNYNALLNVLYSFPDGLAEAS